MLPGLRRIHLLLLCVLLNACTVPPSPTPVPPLPASTPAGAVPVLTPVDWSALDGWLNDNPAEALGAFLQGCRALQGRPQWQEVCAAAAGLDETVPEELARQFFESYFIPHQVRNADASDSGLITGYYVPELAGSREQTERYRYPLYAVPDDLLTIDLRGVYPDLANYRLRGRLVGNRVVPYWSRAEIDDDPSPLAGKELFWVEDPVELFFLQIQGSGRILLENGEQVMVHYADQNGYPFRSIGKILLDQGAMTRDQMSMQNIKLWAQNNPGQVATLLNENASYVFFETLPGNPPSPPGALGVPLTPGRSIAVDPRSIPLGVPVFLSSTWPGTRDQPLQRLVMAQDTGGAIRGAVRADFFWGLGAAAGELAGRMRYPGRLWVLVPREPTPPPGEETP